MKKVLLIIIIFFASGFFFFSDDGLFHKDIFMSSAMAEIEAPVSFFTNIFSDEKSSGTRILEEENSALRAQIFALEHQSKLDFFNEKKAIQARVYSTYPTNNHHLVSINAGSAEGVAEGMPVLFKGAFLFGRVVETSLHRSIVQTVFDPAWEIPVKVGDDSVNALFVGGRDAKLTLILKNEVIFEQDTIYSSSKEFPYGLVLGNVLETLQSPELTFQEASIDFPYDASSVNEVTILLES